MDKEDMSNDSSDEDYVPEGAENQELPSEEDSDGEPEDDNDDGKPASKGGKRSRPSATKRKSKKTKVHHDDDDDEPDDENSDSDNVPPVTEEAQKKKTDSLWADFLKDTDTKPKSQAATLPAAPKSKLSVAAADSASGKSVLDSGRSAPSEKTVTVTQVYEFAGEEVIVNKEVRVDASAKRGTGTVRGRGGRGAATSAGGLSSVLSQLGKKQKISTLEKSKLDWDRFKQHENIDEELNAHNKGKHGYLERQDFLQRADQRQFELEKEMRTKQRSHRL